MDIVTYALLKKKIGKAASGVTDVYLDPETGKVVFVIGDGMKYPLTLPVQPERIAISDTEPTDPDIWIWIDTSVTGSFPVIGGGGDEGGDGPVFEGMPPTVNAFGGLAANTDVNGLTLREVVELALWPVQPPKLEYTTNLVSNLISAGQKTTEIDFDINVKKLTNNISDVSIYLNDNKVYTFPIVPLAGGELKYKWTGEVNNNSKFKIVATDKQGMITEKILDLTFIGKVYYGYVNANINKNNLTTDDIQNLQHNNLTQTAELLYENIAFTNSKVVYAYPVQFGSIKHIYDSSGFDYIYSYDKITIEIDGVDYICLIFTDPASISDFKQHYVL